MTYKDSEVCLYLLIHMLHLPISLWVVGGGRSQLNSEESCKLMGEVGYEGRSVIADHFLQKSMVVPDVVGRIMICYRTCLLSPVQRAR